MTTRVRTAVTITATTLALALTGCSGGGNSSGIGSTTGQPTTGATAPAQKLSPAPIDPFKDTAAYVATIPTGLTPAGAPIIEAQGRIWALVKDSGQANAAPTGVISFPVDARPGTQPVVATIATGAADKNGWPRLTVINGQPFLITYADGKIGAAKLTSTGTTVTPVATFDPDTPSIRANKTNPGFLPAPWSPSTFYSTEPGPMKTLSSDGTTWVTSGAPTHGGTVLAVVGGQTLEWDGTGKPSTPGHLYWGAQQVSTVTTADETQKPLTIAPAHTTSGKWSYLVPVAATDAWAIVDLITSDTTTSGSTTQRFLIKAGASTATELETEATGTALDEYESSRSYIAKGAAVVPGIPGATKQTYALISRDGTVKTVVAPTTGPTTIAGFDGTTAYLSTVISDTDIASKTVTAGQVSDNPVNRTVPLLVTSNGLGLFRTWTKTTPASYALAAKG